MILALRRPRVWHGWRRRQSRPFFSAPGRVWASIPFDRFLFLSVVLAGWLTGCTPREPRADLVILNGAEPESLDPAACTAQPDLRLVSAVFEGLTRYDARTGAAIPGLAERWEISADQRQYTFFLRTNALWSTGEPITAADVVYSWRRILDPKSAAEYAGLLYYVKNAEAYNTNGITDPGLIGIHARDARTVTFELTGPTAFFLSLCASPTAAVVPRDVIERAGDRWLLTRPLKVSGPYTVERWRLNDKIRLRKNPRYWDAAQTQSEVVDVLPTSSASVALNLYESGAADIVWDKFLVPNELLDVLLKRPDFHTYDYLGSFFCRYNVSRPPFNDVRVRRAFTQAIDKAQLARKITKGGETPARSHTPPATPNYTPPDGLEFDPAAARRWLAEAGFPGGAGFPAVVYLFNAAGGGGANQDGKIAVELQAMWQRELGVTVALKAMENKTFLAAQNHLEYDVCRSSWIADYDDANTFLDMFMSNNGNNRTGWRNARYDALVRAANQQLDSGARARLLREAETILVRDEVPITPLFFYKGISYYDPEKIQGIYPNVIDQHPINTIRKVAGRTKP